MKKFIFPILFWFCFSSVFGQTNIEVLEFDFEKKAFTVDPEAFFADLKEGQFYRIKITNYNPNLYTTKIQIDDTVLTKELTFPALSLLGIDDIAKVTSGLNFSAYAEFIETTKHLSSLEMAVLNLAPNQKSNAGGKKPTDFTTDLTNKLSEANETLVQLNEQLKKLTLNVDSIYFRVAEVRLSAVAVNQNVDLTSIQDFGFENALKNFKRVRDTLKSLNEQFDNWNIANETLMEEAKKSEADEVKVALKKVQKNASTVGAQITTISGLINAEKANEVLTAIVKLNTVTSFETAPIQKTGNQSKVKLDLVPRDKTFNIESYSFEASLPHRQKYYAGVSLGFYMADFKNESYSIKGVATSDSTSEFTLVNEGLPSYEMGTVALMKFGLMLDQMHNIGAHVNVGTGVSISKSINARLFTGAGISIGNRHKLVLDGLVGVGYRARLSTVYDLSTTYNQKPENFMVNEMKVGLGASIGYIYQF